MRNLKTALQKNFNLIEWGSKIFVELLFVSSRATEIDLTKKTRYVKLLLAYDGSAFFGYQYQPNVCTVQGALERALKLIIGQKCRAVGAGRTDAGVHAVEQVAVVKFECPIPLEKLIIGLNGALPATLRVRGAEEVSRSFHPCFSAKGKHYRYLFHQVKQKSPFLERNFWQITEKPNIELMAIAAKEFVGEHDFASFAKSPKQYESTVRRILKSDISFKGDVIAFDVVGAGFMHNMVRNMAKALYLVGIGKMAVYEIRELYRNRDRKRLGAPAPPGGLYMMKVMY